ncbi:MAG: glycosyltransferase family 4 protein [Candidatus Methanoperedens sp.]|nr:glycosyltransferase family 4 protein [Candidatus Methanoperedens sp.]
MNILQICANYPPVASGFGIYAQNLSLELAKYGVKTTILTFKNNNNINNEQKQIGLLNIKRISAYNLKSIEFPIFYPTILYHIHKIVIKNDIDVINSHTRFFTSTYYASLYRKINKNIIFVHTEHGASSIMHKKKIISTISNSYDRTFSRWVIKTADIPIAIGPSSRDFLKKLGCKKDIEIIPNSIDCERFKKQTGYSKNNKPEEILITFIGRLVESKGVSDLIKVFSELEDIYNIRLWIVGTGPDEKKFRDLSKKLHIKKIDFLGFREDISNILSISDVFVNPSYYDSAPTTLLEASCIGRRIISSNVGDASYMLGESYPYIYDAGKLDLLKKHLIMIIEKSDFHDDILKDRVHSLFNWNINARKYLDLLNSKCKK